MPGFRGRVARGRGVEWTPKRAAKFAPSSSSSGLRDIEKKSGSVWLLRLEGDNLIRNIHIHFIISQDGLRNSGAESNLFILKNKFSALKKEFLLLNRASIKFEEYDKQKAGAFYLSKVEVGVLNRAPSYFDYLEDGICVKFSGKLKRRYKEFNLNRPTYSEVS